jgi:hypothetical protein
VARCLLAVSLSLCIPHRLSHCASLTVSPTVPLAVSCSPSLPLCLSHLLSHCASRCVLLTVSPPVPLSPSLPLCLALCPAHRLSHRVFLTGERRRRQGVCQVHPPASRCAAAAVRPHVPVLRVCHGRCGRAGQLPHVRWQGDHGAQGSPRVASSCVAVWKRSSPVQGGWLWSLHQPCRALRSISTRGGRKRLVLLGFASLRRMFTGLDGWLLEPIER